MLRISASRGRRVYGLETHAQIQRPESVGSPCGPSLQRNGGIDGPWQEKSLARGLGGEYGQLPRNEIDGYPGNPRLMAIWIGRYAALVGGEEALQWGNIKISH